MAIAQQRPVHDDRLPELVRDHRLGNQQQIVVLQGCRVEAARVSLSGGQFTTIDYPHASNTTPTTNTLAE
jgi:hypothetical protein